MNTKVILFIMMVGWLPVGQMSEGADRVEYSEQMEMRIDRLLAEAMGHPRLADEKFREAERLLAENKNKLNPLTVSFIQISLAQKRGRVSVGRWQADKTDNNSRLTGQKLLSQALTALTAFGEQAENVATALETQLGEEVSESERWRQASSYVVRTEYALAWTRYYLGLVSNDDRSKNAYLAKAREGFGHFTQEGIQNHPIIAECFLGLGMCYFEQARYQTVAELLEMTRPAMASWPSAPVPIALFKRITYLRIKALRELPSHLTVTQAAGQYFNLIPADKPLDAMELEILLWWAGSAAALIDDPQASTIHQPLRKQLDDVAQRVMSHGQGGLERLGEVLADFKIETAYALLAQGRKDFAAKKYALAFMNADKGLKLSPADSIAVELRYLKTAASWNMENWRAAFSAAQEFLARHGADKRADEVCKVGLQAGFKAVKGEGENDKGTGGGPAGVLKPDAYLTFLDFVARDRPDHPEVKHLPWYRGRTLLEARRYGQAERVLRQIPETSSLYPQGLYGLAAACFHQGREAMAEARGGRDEKLAWECFQRAAEAVGRFSRLEDPNFIGADENSIYGRLQKGVGEIALVTARGMMGLTPPQARAALALMADMEPLDRGNQPDADTRKWKQAIVLEANALMGNRSGMNALLDDILKMKNREIDPPMVRALTKVCDRLEKDQAGGHLPEEENLAINDRLIAIYEMLLQWEAISSLSADAPKQLVNPEVLRRRLGDVLMRLERYPQAVMHYQWLMNAGEVKKSIDLLQAFARANEMAGNYQTAIEPWRTLSKGVSPDKAYETFLEAKYHLIDCYYRTGQIEQARKLLAFFRLRFKQIELRDWDQRFKTLGEALAQ